MKTQNPQRAARPLFFVAALALAVLCLQSDALCQTSTGGGYFSGGGSDDSYENRTAPMPEPIHLRVNRGDQPVASSPLPTWTYDAPDPSPYGAAPIPNPSHRTDYTSAHSRTQVSGTQANNYYTTGRIGDARTRTVGRNDSPMGGTVAHNIPTTTTTYTQRPTVARSPMTMAHAVRPAASYGNQVGNVETAAGEVPYQQLPVKVGPGARLVDDGTDIPGPEFEQRMSPASEDPFAAGVDPGGTFTGDTPGTYTAPSHSPATERQPATYVQPPRRASNEPQVLHPSPTASAPGQNTTLIYNVRPGEQMLKMTVHGSKHLRLKQRIPMVEVDNPDVLTMTVISPNEIRVVAKAPGVARISMQGEDGMFSTINVLSLGDVSMLTYMLQSQFPTSQLSVIAVGDAVAIRGYVEKPEDVDFIVRFAEQYYPKVINQMQVSGVQQVLLAVKVMEVSRTKLRQLGFDFAKVTNGSFVTSGVSDALNYALNKGIGGDLKGFEQSLTGGGSTFSFAIKGAGQNTFFWGMLEAMREDKLGKVLAEPTIVARSGRPSYFEVGGQFPFVGAVDNNGIAQIEWKNFGTRVDFLAICLGNGRIRLEVRPIVSERDDAAGVINQGNLIPALKVRSVDSGVELMAGQTLAIGGLIQERVEAQHRGIPWVSTLPYVGALFRSVKNLTNEVELIITVTPQLVEPLNPDEVPACLPGQSTTNPGDCELYFGGHLEVPNCTPSHGPDQSCPQCEGSVAGPIVPESSHHGGGMIHGSGMIQHPQVQPIPATPNQGMPGGVTPGMMIPSSEPVPAPTPSPTTMPGVSGDRRPTNDPVARSRPSAPLPRGGGVATAGTPVRLPSPLMHAPRPPASIARPNNPYTHQRVNVNSPETEQPSSSEAPGFIGPVGYGL